MERKFKGKRASEQQKAYLVDFLEANIDLAHDRFTSVDGARARENTWNALAVELNAIGGANKDGTKWRKFWMDQKLYTKDCHAQLQAALIKSEINGTKKLKPLSELEERILAIMKPQAVDGDIEVIELGAMLDFDTNEPYTSISPVPLQIIIASDHNQSTNIICTPSTSRHNAIYVHQPPLCHQPALSQTKIQQILEHQPPLGSRFCLSQHPTMHQPPVHQPDEQGNVCTQMMRTKIIQSL